MMRASQALYDFEWLALPDKELEEIRPKVRLSREIIWLNDILIEMIKMIILLLDSHPHSMLEKLEIARLIIYPKYNLIANSKFNFS